jgi:hypothetical protein
MEVKHQMFVQHNNYGVVIEKNKIMKHVIQKIQTMKIGEIVVVQHVRKFIMTHYVEQHIMRKKYIKM